MTYGTAQIPTDGLDLFLKGFTRRSTLRVARWAWERLKEHPEGEPLNLTEAARELGTSRVTVHRALDCLLLWGRLLEVEGYRTGRGRPGRARAYRLHPAFLKADRISVSAKRVNLPQTPSSSPKSRLGHTDAPASLTPPPYQRNPQPNRSLALDKLLRADPNAILDPDRAVRLILARIREELRAWPVGWDRRELILTGVAVAVRDRVRGPVPRGRAICFGRAIVAILRQGENISMSVGGACRYGRFAVRQALGSLLDEAKSRGKVQC